MAALATAMGRSSTASPASSSRTKFRGPAWADEASDEEDTRCGSVSSALSTSSVRSASPCQRSEVATPPVLPPGDFYVPVALGAQPLDGGVWCWGGQAEFEVPSLDATAFSEAWSWAPARVGPETSADIALPLSNAPCSVGSLGHPYSCGAACTYASEAKGCKDGENCTHCHLCPWSSRLYNMNRRMKRKVHRGYWDA